MEKVRPRMRRGSAGEAGTGREGKPGAACRWKKMAQKEKKNAKTQDIFEKIIDCAKVGTVIAS